MREIVARAVEYTPTLISHFLPPFLLSYLSLDYALLSLTIIYALYQYIDYSNGEDPRETAVDLVEYALGLFLGSLIKSF